MIQPLLAFKILKNELYKKYSIDVYIYGGKRNYTRRLFPEASYKKVIFSEKFESDYEIEFNKIETYIE